MNPAWKCFLQSRQAEFIEDGRIGYSLVDRLTGNRVMPVPHLSVLKVGGVDAAKLLQGQMTCNVNDVGETQSSLGAFCNPKGRAIATFLLVKAGIDYLLVLPFELLPIVRTHLRKYVLRSDVQFNDCSEELCLFGILHNEDTAGTLFATERNASNKIRFSPTHNRYLVIAPAEEAVRHWQELTGQNNFQPAPSDFWRLQDLQAGIPWLSKSTTEAFIPQMLNLDRLGGISFNKGCYTGQEVVARTHYLGKSKRSLYLAESSGDYTPEDNTVLVDLAGDASQPAGHVVQAINLNNRCLMQAVLLQNENATHELAFQDRPEIKIRTLPFVS